MSAKLLFISGIVAAHGAVAAAWMGEVMTVQRIPVTTCVQPPAQTPHFQPKAELLAWVVPAPAEVAQLP